MILQQLKEWLAEATTIRQQFHSYPELGFQEHKTQQKIIELLKKYGVEHIDTRFGKTGVIAVIKGNRSGSSIGLRADMDALPIQENNTFNHKSQIHNQMHGCGHDGHTTMLLMAAKYLALHRDFSGQAVLFFQPAEEGLGGAETMVVTEKVLEHYPVDAIYALHNWPNLPVGTFAFRKKNIMASSDRLFITIKGKSGHAGLPHRSQDPLLVATHIYQGIQGLVSRTFNPLDPVVISITQIHAGQTNNVIADEAKMSGTFRTHSHEVRNDLIKKLQLLVENIGKAFDMEAIFELGQIHHPVTINTDLETDIAITAASAIVGKENVITDITPMMTAEDFSHFLVHCQGCYGFIGNGTEAPYNSDLHNSFYDFNDAIIPYGASYFVKIIHAYQ
ncbi:amidohydrolase [Wohlfahrtiimonas larvae]|uniref:M20 aminoacylase family protein n=1 Tax=Wohlfahrtiimonas larvae TaxID=1157986 RepID=A0ABP9MQY8_9GAMM|nr:amidohydrolase [Wohlfahrtiimonas larvae]